MRACLTRFVLLGRNRKPSQVDPVTVLEATCEALAAAFAAAVRPAAESYRIGVARVGVVVVEAGFMLKLATLIGLCVGKKVSVGED